MVANSGLYTSETAKQEESAELRAFLISVTGMKHPDCLKKTKRRYLDFNFNSSLQKKKKKKKDAGAHSGIVSVLGVLPLE